LADRANPIYFRGIIYTAFDKLTDYDHFKWQINNQPFSYKLKPVLAPALPTAELLLTFLLIWPRTSLIGLYGSASLLSIFTMYTALLSLNFYNHLPCPYATAFDYFSWPLHLVMNLFFLGMTLTGLYFIKTEKKTKRPPLP
jgi:hypothetical protein